MAVSYSRELMFVTLTCILACFATPTAEAQTILHRFAGALDEANAEDKVLVVYFHSSDLMHPRDIFELVSDEAQESIRAAAVHTEIDLGPQESRNLADAFFDYSKLGPQDQKQPFLGIVQRNGRRAVTILHGVPTEITTASWAEVLAQVGRLE